MLTKLRVEFNITHDVLATTETSDVFANSHGENELMKRSIVTAAAVTADVAAGLNVTSEEITIASATTELVSSSNFGFEMNASLPVPNETSISTAVVRAISARNATTPTPAVEVDHVSTDDLK